MAELSATTDRDALKTKVSSMGAMGKEMEITSSSSGSDRCEKSS